jgi:ATP-dependent Clp protease ATP-binding subunit ClpA
MHLDVTDAVRELIAREGFDVNFGARPLRRQVQRMIEDPLSEEVLLGRFGEGDQIRADVEDEKIIFRKAGVPEEALALN